MCEVVVKQISFFNLAEAPVYKPYSMKKSVNLTLLTNLN